MTLALKDNRLKSASGGNYYPAPTLGDSTNTVGARIAAHAAASRNQYNPFAAQDRYRAYALMSYAHARGATIRQLCEVSGWSSSSTVLYAIRRFRRGAEADLGVLADECPVDLR